MYCTKPYTMFSCTQQIDRVVPRTTTWQVGAPVYAAAPQLGPVHSAHHAATALSVHHAPFTVSHRDITDMNALNESLNTFPVTAHSVGTWVHPWISAASVVHAQQQWLRINPPGSTKLDQFHCVVKTKRPLKYA